MHEKRNRVAVAIVALALAGALAPACANGKRAAGEPGEVQGIESPPNLADYTAVGATAVVPVAETPDGVLPASGPIDAIGVYVVGFHPMVHDPEHQMAVHHYCTQKTPHFAQCVLFDGNTADANMNGIEYIVSEEAFEALPPEEKILWHPHNFEILAGQLAAPGRSPETERALMRTLMNSYGKTWHTWSSRPFEGEPDPAPLGEPKLAWSFNAVGEAIFGLVETRDREMNVRSDLLREQRRDLVVEAAPQCGVDLLSGRFASPTETISGIEPRETSACHPTAAP